MDYKYLITLMLVSVIFLAILFIPNQSQNQTLNANEYFRMHIRANSNSEVDQNIKYKVRDGIVQAVTPLLCDVQSKEQAMSLLSQNLNLVVDTANQILANNGFDYTARASIREELFPTRSYDNVTLASGVYDSLIVELGSGTGDNWWCVVYPPLCFVGENSSSSNIIYRSKLLDIINNFYGG